MTRQRYFRSQISDCEFANRNLRCLSLALLLFVLCASPFAAYAQSATATLSGEPGELLLWLTGRKTAAQVELDGAVDLVAALRDAPMTL